MRLKRFSKFILIYEMISAPISKIGRPWRQSLTSEQEILVEQKYISAYVRNFKNTDKMRIEIGLTFFFDRSPEAKERLVFLCTFALHATAIYKRNV